MILPSLSMILTILVSTPNPAPSLVKSFATIKSKFFFLILRFAFSIKSFVSAANPTNILSFFILPISRAISLFLSNSITKSSSDFFIFSLE